MASVGRCHWLAKACRRSCYVRNVKGTGGECVKKVRRTLHSDAFAMGAGGPGVGGGLVQCGPYNHSQLVVHLPMFVCAARSWTRRRTWCTCSRCQFAWLLQLLRLAGLRRQTACCSPLLTPFSIQGPCFCDTSPMVWSMMSLACRVPPQLVDNGFRRIRQAPAAQARQRARGSGPAPASAPPAEPQAAGVVEEPEERRCGRRSRRCGRWRGRQW